MLETMEVNISNVSKVGSNRVFIFDIDLITFYVICLDA